MCIDGTLVTNMVIMTNAIFAVYDKIEDRMENG